MIVTSSDVMALGDESDATSGCHRWRRYVRLMRAWRSTDGTERPILGASAEFDREAWGD